LARQETGDTFLTEGGEGQKLKEAERGQGTKEVRCQNSRAMWAKMKRKKKKI